MELNIVANIKFSGDGEASMKVYLGADEALLDHMPQEYLDEHISSAIGGVLTTKSVEKWFVEQILERKSGGSTYTAALN